MVMKPHEFWQEIHAPGSFDLAGPHSGFFPVTLDDGRQLRLPIRPLADGEHALASLIINQASFPVVEALADDLAGKLKHFEIDIVVGLPTLGLTLAAEVARRLGHSRYVPLGTSRKFWYLEELSVPMSSITTQQQKRLYIDPRMLPLLEGRRVALVDDVISSGTSIIAGLSLLAASNIEPVVIGAAMLQSDRWRDRLSDFGAQWPGRVQGVFTTPLLKKAGDGWIF
ncbi:phosphoribosyltransferase [Agrobacterium rosae]|uniref:Phosphoribosyltransferase n=2 Tax=Agrobacterium rosae TaxID=1972867 RepID=A0AAE5S0D6_9HYPH|nr:phosphoribosyltransferase [Agrobacterium rosae]KAA3521572.1 phosphoribosyltransferase [Agrobacterium rosae]MCM2432549.1 phosphoribosyltransferase [Agrobacterium rosae]MQB48497.1 phosphoribosyltransferase [Agrobacterium rosae]POO53269.1 phosphoribosyltransferase [Agrobacterium rosae]